MSSRSLLSSGDLSGARARSVASAVFLCTTALTMPSAAWAQAVIVHNGVTSYNGDVTENADVYVGDGTAGTLNLGSGGTYTNTGDMFVGYRPGSSGVVNATGGWNSNGDIIIGASGGTGEVNLSGSAALRVGTSGTGTIRIDEDGTGIGRLWIGSATSTLAVGNIAFGSANGTLEFAHGSTAPYNVGAILSGPGTIEQVSGITNLIGSSGSFTGTANVLGGTLLLNGALGGAIDVQAGTLGGSGSTTGIVSVADGATLAPGGDGAVGTLTMGGLTLSNGSLLAFDLGAPTEIGGTTNDLLVVNGDVVLDGTLNITNNGIDGGFGGGLYRLISYTGALTDNGLDIGTIPAGAIGSDLEIQTAVAGQVNLFNGAAQNLPFWDGNGPHGDGVIQGGSGIWTADPDGTSWTNITGTQTGGFSPNPGLAIFTGTSGTVTVDNTAGTIGLTGLQFAVGGYVVTGGTLDLAEDMTMLRVGDGTGPGAAFVGTISSTLAGSGGVDKTDLGRLILSGNNSYAGATQVSGGVLEVRGGNAITDTSAVTLADVSGVVLAVTNSERIGSLTGGGTSGGNVAIAAGQTLSTGDATNTTFSGVISGAGNLGKEGTGSFTLAAANTYTGATLVNSGTLIGGATNAFGSGSAVAVGSTGTLDLGGFNQAIGTLAGSGVVTNNGAGGRVLTVGGAGSTTFSGTIQNGNQVLGFAKSGSGTLTLTGNNSYTGGTSVTGGALILDGRISSGGLIGVSGSGTTLGGSGETGRTAVMGSGTILQPGGTGIGTLTLGGLTMNANSRLAVQLGTPGTAGASDRVQVNGDLTLNGTSFVDVTDAGGFGPGVYRLIDYTGLLGGTGTLAIGTQPGGATLAIQTAADNQVNLVNSTGLTLQFWDGGDPALWNNGVVDGGSGTWMRGMTGWTDANGLVTSTMQPDPSFAIFQGTPGTVTLQATPGATFFDDPTPVSTLGMQFAVDGYLLNGDFLNLLAGDRIIRVGDGSAAGAGYTATISAAIVGSGRLVKTDLGTLSLTANNNSYSGGTEIQGGTLRVVTNSLGSGAVTMAGGVIDYVGGANIANALSGTLTLNQTGGSATQSGAIGGTSSLTKTGSGTLTLTGSNTYSGATTVTAGQLTLGNALASSAASSYTVASGATLSLGAASSIGALNGAGSIVGNGNVLTLGSNGADGLFTGTFAGVGTLNKTGAGTQTLTGDLASGATIAAGTLQIGNGGATGSIAGDVVNQGALVFDRTGALTYSAQISGAGSVAIDGGVALTLTATNSYTGGTTITDGQLILAGADGWIVGDVVNNDLFTIARTGDNTFTGLISGTGAVEQANGTLTFTADNTYTGSTTVAGTLRLGDGGTTGSIASGAVDLLGTGALVVDRSNTLVLGAQISGTGSFTQAGTGTTILTGDSTFTGGTTISAGTLQLGAGGTSGSITGDVANNGLLALDRSDTLTLGGAISGTGAVRQQGTGTTILTGNNGYTGGTAITAGTLRIGDGATSGSIVGNVTNDAALVFDRADDIGFAGVISGSGTVTQAGAGVLTLTGDNTYSGGTIIGGGTLQVGDGGTTGSIGSGDVANGGTLAFNRSDTVTFGGALSGVGGLVQSGTGTLVLTGTNSYTGGTTISGGVLRIGAGGTTGSIVGDVANDAALVFDRSDTVTFGGVVSGTGSLEQAGAGTLVLSGANSYTGGTTISAGRLTLATGGSVAGGILNNAELEFAQGGATSYGGAITGTGAVYKTGAGTLTLSGASTYTGGTFVSGGTLDLAGSLQGDVLVGGGMLTGGGSVAGLVAIGDGATLAGVQGQTLSMGALALSGGSLIDATLAAPGGAALFAVAGDLTLDGTLSVTDGGGFGAGVYGLVTYGGTLTDNGLAIGTLPAGTTAADVRVQTSVAGEVNLINSAGLALSFWDGGNPANIDNGTVDGGAGTWRLDTDSWTNASGTINGRYNPNPSFAIFQGSAGTVTVDNSAGAIGVTGMQFATDGYRLQGDPITLSQALTTIRVGNGTAAGAGYTTTIASNLTGDATLVKTDLGTLVLTGANSYTGGTRVDAGTLVGNAASIRGAVANAGTVEFAQATNATFAGAISGSGTFIKSGAGDLTLTGASSSPWAVRAGSLISTTALFTGNLNISSNASFVFDQPSSGAYGGALSGAGSVLVRGGGAVQFTGSSAGFTGLTTVGANSQLAVNGTLAGSLLVRAGGTLSGTGTVGNTRIEGTIAPGNSIGTLNVNGSLVFAPGSTYQAEFNAAGQSDLIAVSGTATLAGTVTAIGAAGNYAPLTNYTIVTAQGGISGTFAGITTNLAFLTPSLSYTANSAIMTMERNNISFDGIGTSFNQRSVAAEIEDQGFGAPLYDAILSLSAADARSAFDQLAGDDFATVRGALVEDSRFVRDAINRRGAMPFQGEGGSGSVWGEVLGSWKDADGDGNAAGYSRDITGILTGVEGAIGSSVRIGGMVGYDRTEFRTNRPAVQEVETLHVGAYANARAAGFHLTGGVAYAAHDVSSSRTISFAGFGQALAADYDLDSTQVFGEVAYPFQLEQIALQPFVGLAHVSLSSDAAREQGGSAALEVDSRTLKTNFATLGVRSGASFDLGSVAVMLDGSAAVRRAFDGRTTAIRSAFANGSEFTVLGLPIARTTGAIEAGLSVALSPRFTIGATYSGQFAEGSDDHGLRGGLSWRF